MPKARNQKNYITRAGNESYALRTVTKASRGHVLWGYTGIESLLKSHENEVGRGAWVILRCEVIGAYSLYGAHRILCQAVKPSSVFGEFNSVKGKMPQASDFY